MFAEYVAAPTLADAEEWLFGGRWHAVIYKGNPRPHRLDHVHGIGAASLSRARAAATRRAVFPAVQQRGTGASDLRAHIVHGYTMSDIARSLGLHLNTVSRIVCKLRHRAIEV